MEPDTLTIEGLRGALTAAFGPGSEYRGVWSWPLGRAVGLEARVHVRCDEDGCALWISDPAEGGPPRRLVSVRTVDEIPAGIEAVRRFIDEHPGRRGGRAAGRRRDPAVCPPTPTPPTASTPSCVHGGRAPPC